MGSLGKREKILLIILGAVVVFYLYFSLFLTPLQEKMAASQGNIDKYNQDVQRIRSASAVIEQQRKQLDELKVKLSDALKTLPEMERNPEIAYNLKKLGDASSVTINTLGFGEVAETTPQDPKENPQNPNPPAENTGNQTESQGQGQQAGTDSTAKRKMYSVAVNLNVSGDYNSIMNFIASVEKDKRFSLISAVNMTKDHTSGKLAAAIGMTYYYSENMSRGELKYDFNDNRKDGKGNLFQ